MHHTYKDYKGHKTTFTLLAVLFAAITLLPAKVRAANDINSQGTIFTLDPLTRQAVITSLEAEGDVEVPSTVSDTAVTYQVVGIGDSCFYENDRITSVILPSGITSIGDFAFAECQQLQRIEIPSGVVTIGSYCFSDCEKLTSIVIPATVTNIGFGCFNTCRSLTAFQVDKDNRRYAASGNMLLSKDMTTLIACPSAKGTFAVPATVTTLSRLCFAGCVHLSRISIPASVIRLDASTFNTCPMLANIDIDARNRVYSAADGMIFDRNKTCLIAYPNAHGDVDNIPATVTSLDKRCFEGCDLRSVILPESVAELKDFCFEGCDSMVAVTLPASLAKISHYAFYDCENLTSISCAAPLPPEVGRRFEAFDPTRCLLTVPAGSMAEYKSAPAWREFKIEEGK